jgi:Guanylate-binding protein, N-terminal domain
MSKLVPILQIYCGDPKPSEHLDLQFMNIGLIVEDTKVIGCKAASDRHSLIKSFEGRDISLNGFWIRPGDGSGAILLGGVPDDKSSTLFHFTGRPSMQSSLKEVKKFKSATAKITFNDSKEMYCIYNVDKKAEIGQLRISGKTENDRAINAIYNYQDDERDGIQEIMSLTICERNSKIYFLDEEYQLFEYSLNEQKSSVVRKTDKDDRYQIDILPKTGKSYKEIGSPSSGKLIFLSNEYLIDVYDLNFSLLLTISENRSPSFCSFLQDCAHYIFYKGMNERLKCSRLAGMEDSIVHSFSDENSTSGQKVIAGSEDTANTVLNIVLRAVNKFGPPTAEGGFAEIINVYLDCARKEVGNASNHLMDSKFTMIKIVPVQSGYINYSTFKTKPAADLLMLIVSRVSIHVASIQQYNLVPLFDGKFDMDEFNKLLRGDENKSSVNKIMNAVKFGHFEKLISEWQGPINVASIVGRQSSGKSYMLNRLFGTRFNVAAERCTDGIWMSAGFYKPPNEDPRLIVVMDCEGLFSVSRSASEEMKLCLALASLTDAFIANQDLSFNRNLSAMIESLTRGVGKLKGEKLFKGRIAFFMRDVSNNPVEFDGARREFKANMVKIVSSENSFLFKLFDRKAENYTFVHFEDPDFPTLIKKAKDALLNGMDKRRWINGDEFLRSFKGVLAQLTMDDDLDLDEHTAKNQSENSLKKAVEALLLIPEGLELESEKLEALMKITPDRKKMS